MKISSLHYTLIQARFRIMAPRGYLPPTIIPNDYTNLMNMQVRLKRKQLPLPKHYVYEVRNDRIYQYTPTKGDIFFGKYSINSLKRALGL